MTNTMCILRFILSSQNQETADMCHIVRNCQVNSAVDSQQVIVGTFRDFTSVKIKSGPCINRVITPVIICPVDNCAACIDYYELIACKLQSFDIEIIIYPVVIWG